MKTILLRYFDDLLILAGCCMVLYGTWLLSPVAVWFVAGAMLVTAGVLIGIGGAKSDNP